MRDAVRLSLGEGSTILFMVGDITKQDTDAIVNAANSSLMGGGGVDGAIHRAGGPAILDACKQIVAERGSLPAGQAVSTTGGKLPAGFVIHTVGPVWHGGSQQEPQALASCYRESLRVADQLQLVSVAFPSISTGVYGYPINKAAPVAVGTCAENLPQCRRVREVRFILFDEQTFDAYVGAAEKLLHEAGQAKSRYSIEKIQI